MRNKSRIAALLAIFASAFLLAQAGSAPYPSQLRLGTRDSEVLLSWIDATSGAASYAVYRHTAPITADTLGAAAFLGDVPQGTESFSDFPPTTSKYFYAVLAKDAKGNLFKVFKSTVNATSSGIAVAKVRPSPATAATVTAVTASPTATGSETKKPAVEPSLPVAELPKVADTAPKPAAEAPKASFDPLRLRLGVRESQILLSWETASKPAGGWFLVYRHSAEIGEGSFPQAKLVVQLPATVFEFIDTPPDGQAYFYAVLYKDAAGTVSKTFVKLENVSVVGVTVKGEGAPGSGSIATIEGIDARVEEAAIKVSYTSTKLGRKLVIYRNTVPVLDIKSLLESTLVAVFSDSGQPFVDYPVPGISYYYAIIDEEQLKYGAITLVSGKNATSKAAKIETGSTRVGLPEYSSAATRAMPLPYLSLSKAVTPGGSPLAASIAVPDRVDISPEAQKSVDAVLGSMQAGELKVPQASVLPIDLGDAVGSEDYALKAIIKEQFLIGNYQGSIVQLQNFLSLYRTEDIEARAHFYLGQAYALTGNYREASFQFLEAQNRYLTQTMPWIDYLIRMLHGR